MIIETKQRAESKNEINTKEAENKDIRAVIWICFKNAPMELEEAEKSDKSQ